MKTSLTLLLGMAAIAPLPARAATDPTPAPLTLAYDATSRERPVAPVQGACAVHVAPTRDERQNKETIGSSMNGALLTGDASPWITDSLLHLRDFGYAVDPTAGDAAPASGVRIKTTLTRAYTWQIGLKLFGMVAVKAEYFDRNGLIQEKYYRAHGDKTNMWGAASEYVTTLNYGINNLLPAIAQDLVSLCQGRKVDPYTYAGPDPVAKK